MVTQIDNFKEDTLESDLRLRRNDDVVAAVGCGATSMAIGALICSGPAGPVFSGPALIALVCLLVAGTGAAVDAVHTNNLLTDVIEQKEMYNV